MRTEVIITQDQRPNPTYDAVLVHGYWMSRSSRPDAIDGFRGSLRTRLATRSGALFYHNEGPTKLVFLGAKVKGPSYPSTAELSAAEATQKYAIPPEDIVALPVGYGTEEEAIKFQELAQDHGWKNVAVVAFRKHYKSIQRFIPENANGEITVNYRPVEDLIMEFDDPNVQGFVRRLNRFRLIRFRLRKFGLGRFKFNLIRLGTPKYELGFRAYELAKNVLMSFPGGKDRLYARSRIARTQKDDSKLNDFIAHRIDVFKS